ncbi:MAG: 16S rRNA (cytosine(1402)-N(4))-methyltransferase RsmH [Oscillospiraceae bacterium]|nr:16S rRNA (cytosine(1402)-N(4))-methyltransferase RsmH [Oscillospiraceae bacterium]
MEFSHTPVLLNECLDGLDIKPDGIYIDGTCGGAGHSAQIAKRLENGKLIGIDRDPDAVTVASQRLNGLNAEVVQGNYSDIKEICREKGIDAVDGILLDLGVSSHQLDTAERGFSYHEDAPLDMRMSQTGETAAELVNSRSVSELERILSEYGEERFSRRIAENIVRKREQEPILTTTQLAQIVSESIPAKFRRDKNPCRRSFQAIRIAVNGELDYLNTALDDCFDMLKPSGRLCIITFHSLEDRMVKQRFASFCQGCVCPPEFPVCVCGRTPRGKLITRKPIEAAEEELASNPRSRSAKLRIVERTNNR